MTFQQLYYFCMVAECKSVTNAADATFITQPALSMTLKKIEDELNVTLFEKKGRNIVLNDSGKIFYNFASQALNNWRKVQEDLLKCDNSQALLRICCVAEYIQKYVLPEFVASNINVPISMNMISDDLMAPALLNDEYDLAISCQHWPNSSEIKSKPLWKNQLLVSVPVSNPLSQKSSITLHELASEPMFRLNTKGDFTTEIDAYMKREHISFNKVVQKVNSETVRMLQNDHDFLYFTNALQTRFDVAPDNRVTIPIEGKEFSRNLYISYLAVKSKRVQPFIKWIQALRGNELNSKYDE